MNNLLTYDLLQPLKQLKQILLEARSIARKKRSEQADQAASAAIAKAFNDRYTFKHEYVTGLPILPGTFYGIPRRAGYAWMCPDCNKIHHPTESSVFDGLHYPACCSTRAGHRLSHGISLS